MNINIELYMKYLSTVPKGKKGYCFATKQELGENGSVDNHPLLNKKVRNIVSNDEYLIDSVCIHWYDLGYFYHASLRDSKNSHATAVIENINSNNELILGFIQEFNSNYVVVD